MAIGCFSAAPIAVAELGAGNSPAVDAEDAAPVMDWLGFAEDTACGEAVDAGVLAAVAGGSVPPITPWARGC